MKNATHSQKIVKIWWKFSNEVNPIKQHSSITPKEIRKIDKIFPYMVRVTSKLLFIIWIHWTQVNVAGR